MAGSCLESFVAPPANGVASWQSTLQAACNCSRKAEEWEQRRGRELTTGKFKRATLVAIQNAQNGQTSLNWSWDTNSIGLRCACASCQLSQRAQSGAESRLHCGMQHLLILVAEQEAICQSEVKGAARGSKGSRAKLTHM